MSRWWGPLNDRQLLSRQDLLNILARPIPKITDTRYFPNFVCIEFSIFFIIIPLVLILYFIIYLYSTVQLCLTIRSYFIYAYTTHLILLHRQCRLRSPHLDRHRPYVLSVFRARNRIYVICKAITRFVSVFDMFDVVGGRIYKHDCFSGGGQLYEDRTNYET